MYFQMDSGVKLDLNVEFPVNHNYDRQNKISNIMVCFAHSVNMSV